VLAEGIEVKGAWMDNGLLHIDLARPQPEVRVKTIRITKASPGGAGQSGTGHNGVSLNGMAGSQLVSGTGEK